MASTIEKIKQLREETAAGMMDVKRALDETDGDVEGARRVLRERGQAINMASLLELDAVIDPAETRAWIARGIRSAGAAAREPRRRIVDAW